MLTTLLIVHGLCAVALLGAVTHQALAVGFGIRNSRRTSFLGRVRANDPAVYSNAIAVLFITVAVLGAILYPAYRLTVRPFVQSMDLRAANGIFELKEHFSAIGLLLLPVYWSCWKQPLLPEQKSARSLLSWALTLMVWWNFIAGQLLVAIKGLFP